MHGLALVEHLHTILCELPRVLEQQLVRRHALRRDVPARARQCMHPSQRTHALDVGDDVIQAPCAALLEQPLKSLLGVLRQVVRCIMW